MRNEAAALDKIPLFNVRFREVFGLPGILAIVTVAVCVLAIGISWLAPWNPGYTPGERANIWLGVAVMPFAGILVGSYVVEFTLKAAHLAFWLVRRQLMMDWRAKAFGAAALCLLGVGLILSLSGPNVDLYGYLLLILSIPFTYWTVIFAWLATDLRRRANRQE